MDAAVDSGGAPAKMPLPALINSATRTQHTHLNRLITARLPLALPPHADRPDLYAAGLLHFTHVYLTFESLFRDLRDAEARSPDPRLSALLDDPWAPSSPPSAPPASHAAPSDARFPLDTAPSSTITTTSSSSSSATASHAAAIRTLLASLVPPSLLRSRRLLTDLSALSGHPTPSSPAALRHVRSHLLGHYPSPLTATFCAHVRSRCAERPHLLLAHAWCFYMAVFAGGRWIRAQLRAAGGQGGEFWRGVTGPHVGDVPARRLEDGGLAFWHFDEGTGDGEETKREFRGRLEAAEGLLSEEEREEVCEEAVRLFEFCAGMVGELDEMYGSQPRQEEEEEEEVGGEAEAEGKATTAMSFAAAIAHPLAASAAIEKEYAPWLVGAERWAFAVVVSCVSWYLGYCFMTARVV